ncbi:MAG: protein kinase, partial [Aliifodinibius sp.]|nr:protein kinase [Phycisphaerae bacterium]NIT56324.1 protein kinase [Fodinibius sp.]NIY24907.1 protein kinase [Fodinibius sp.]
MSLKIGHYKIMRELGKGGMGTVYLGRDPRLERNVAVKILRQQFYQDGPEFSARFEREAKTVASLSHNYIVPIYEFGEDGQWHYFVMPYMVGGSLRDRLQRGAVSLEEATEIVERIGSAL